MDKTYEVRDPIHGFISFNSWERDIINHPVFQRLRRIKQLSWTDMVYPGAMHTRFEHSLGVMHVATKMFDNIVERYKDVLEKQLGFDEVGLKRDRILIRIACLLHDIGHSPFSHAGEELMQNKPGSSPYKHEDYSIAAIKYLLNDVIENNRKNDNYGIKAENVADFIEGNPKLGRQLLWRNLLSGQIDADRADYLLRDSYHAGVSYGNYDINRLLVTIGIGIDEADGGGIIVIDKGGMHVAEGLIIARYMMFSQVYFHRTRRIYDYHIGKVMNELLKESQNGDDKFPPPTSKDNIENYLQWTDWRVLGEIEKRQGGDHAKIISERKHFRCVHETSESPTDEEVSKIDSICNTLGEMVQYVDNSCKTTMYKWGDEIQIQHEDNNKCNVQPLSTESLVVKNLKPTGQIRIYVSLENREEAKRIIAKV